MFMSTLLLFSSNQFEYITAYVFLYQYYCYYYYYYYVL